MEFYSDSQHQPEKAPNGANRLPLPIAAKDKVTMTKKKKKLIVNRGNTYIPVDIENIALFYTVHKMQFAIDFGGHKYTIDNNLTELEACLDPSVFFRVNRGIIVNIEAIKEYKVVAFGKIQIQLVSPGWFKEDIQVSQYTAPAFREWIHNL
jgi:DNA-binding LytR/AlgR family response regulator